MIIFRFDFNFFISSHSGLEECKKETSEANDIFQVRDDGSSQWRNRWIQDRFRR